MERNFESVFEMIFAFRLENDLVGIVRADDMEDAAARVIGKYPSGLVYLERVTELEDVNYGIYEIN